MPAATHVMCEECHDNQAPRSATRAHQVHSYAARFAGNSYSCCRCGCAAEHPILIQMSGRWLPCRGRYGPTHTARLNAGGDLIMVASL